MTTRESSSITLGIEDNYIKVFEDIRINGKRWLTIMGCETLDSFAMWLIRGQAIILSFDGGYVFLDEYVPNVRVTAHPCFVNKKSFRNIEGLSEVLDAIFQITSARRVQVRVFESAGISLRKRLSLLGFQKEATLQNYTLDTTSTPHRLLSIDIWAILK